MGTGFTNSLSAITNIGSWLSNSFSQMLKDLFQPTYDFSAGIKDKFGAVTQMTGIFDGLATQGDKPFEYSITILGVNMKVIDSAWFEPYRQPVRDLLSTVITIGFALTCWRMISGLVGIQVSVVGSGMIADDKKQQKIDSIAANANARWGD